MAMPRVEVSDVELRGQLIRAGEAVFPLLDAANHDQEVFETPAKLDVIRTDAAQHLSLGHGPHFCLGAPLANSS